MRKQEKSFRRSLQEFAITLVIVAAVAFVVGFLTGRLEVLITGSAGSGAGVGAGAVGAALALFWLQKSLKTPHARRPSARP